jgi:hypothetical protein
MARAHVDIGDQIPENGGSWKEHKLKEYSIAEDYVRKAVQVDPNSTWGYCWIAASIGNIAMVSPVSKQVDLVGDIRDAVEKSIALDPKNGLAYHVYGVWHRKPSEIGKARRALAGVLYGRTVPSGSLGKSIEYLKKAVALKSDRDRVALGAGAQLHRLGRMGTGAFDAEINPGTADPIFGRRQT